MSEDRRTERKKGAAYEFAKQSLKAELRQQREFEQGLVDALIEEGLLPSPGSFDPILRNIYLLEVEKYGARKVSPEELVAAWERAQQQWREVLRIADNLEEEEAYSVDTTGDSSAQTDTAELEADTIAESFETPAESVLPWEQIPDHRWDRLALKLWWDGYDAERIAVRVTNMHSRKVKSRTVHNRISLLRKTYTEIVVPKFNDSRRKLEKPHSLR